MAWTNDVERNGAAKEALEEDETNRRLEREERRGTREKRREKRTGKTKDERREGIGKSLAEAGESMMTGGGGGLPTILRPERDAREKFDWKRVFGE